MILVTGNAETKTANAGVALVRQVERWDNTFKLAANAAENNGEKNAESYLVAYNLKYNTNEKSFVFGDIRYRDDKFDSFSSITTVGGGAGYRFFDRETLGWFISGGLGYRDIKVEETNENISGGTFIGESDFRVQVSETTEFINTLRFEGNPDNTYIQSVTSLSVGINDTLSLRVVYDVRHNTDPEPNNVRTDTITSLNLVYKIRRVPRMLMFLP